MTPELSRRLAKISNRLHELLSPEDYNLMMQAAEKATTFENLSEWYKFVIEKAEKDVV